MHAQYTPHMLVIIYIKYIILSLAKQMCEQRKSDNEG